MLIFPPAVPLDRRLWAAGDATGLLWTGVSETRIHFFKKLLIAVMRLKYSRDIHIFFKETYTFFVRATINDCRATELNFSKIADICLACTFDNAISIHLKGL